MGIKMNVIKLISLGFFMLLIIACDGKVYVEVYIDNESDYDLELHYKITGNIDESTKLVKAKDITMIHSYSRGAIVADVSDEIEYIELYFQDTLVYQQNPINVLLWDSGYTDDNEGHTKTLIIKNEDLDIN